MDRALSTIGLAFDLLGRYPHQAGDPPDADAEYEPESTVEVLEAALLRLGHRPVRLGNPHDLLAALGQGRLPPVDAVLTIAEGSGGRNREAWVPVLCEMAGVPTLGSDGLTLSTTLDKAWAHRVVAAAGVPVPAHRVVASPEEAGAVPLPRAVPALRQASLGGDRQGHPAGPGSRARAGLVREVAHVTARYRQPALVEAFVDGPEYTVTLVGNGPPRALPSISSGPWRPRAAWGSTPSSATPPPGGWLHVVPGGLDPRLEGWLLGGAGGPGLRGPGVPGLRPAGFPARRPGTPRFLEINPLPTFAVDGSFGIIAELLGRPLDDLLAEVLAEGLRRLGLRA